MGIFGDYDVRLDPNWELERRPEFSCSISDAAFTAEHIVVAAGKLLILEAPRG